MVFNFFFFFFRRRKLVFRYSNDIIIRLYLTFVKLILYRHRHIFKFWLKLNCADVCSNEFLYLDWSGTWWTAKWLFIGNMDTCTTLKIYGESSTAGPENGANCVYKRIGESNKCFIFYFNEISIINDATLLYDVVNLIINLWMKLKAHQFVSSS